MSTPSDILQRQGAERLYRVLTTRSAPDTIRDPAANTEVSITVPGGSAWELVSIRFVLVTDATVANRSVVLTFDDGTDIFWTVPPFAQQAAGGTNRMNYGTGISERTEIAASGQWNLPIPSFVLLPGSRVRTVTASLQAGDDFGAPVLYVREIGVRGFAAEIAYELAQNLREIGQLETFEQGERF